MPITSKGFEARRFVDIRESINQSLVDNLAIQLKTTPDTVLGVITNIFSSSIADQEDLIQVVASNLDIDTATGTYLDKLVALTGLRRLNESYSSGTVFLTSSQDSTLVARGTLFSDENSNTYEATSSTSINSQATSSIFLRPNATSGIFAIRVNGVNYTTTISAGDNLTIQQVAQELHAVMANTAPTDFALSLYGEQIKIDSANKFDALDVSRSANIDILSLEGAVPVQAVEVGSINPSIGSVNVMVNNNGLFSNVTNYGTFTVGRAVESDEELRVRHSKSLQIQGSPTLSGIFSSLSNLEGVSLVRIFENTTDSIDSTGRPPNSYECIVEGGDTDSIGNIIWETKPAAVGTYGEITSLVTDYANVLQAVNWSRPVLKYINVRVTYEIYDEETLSDDLENTIKEAIVEYGDSLGLDKDIIPQRFMGVVYGATSGLGSITIEVGSSTNPTKTSPDDIPFSTNPVPVSQREKADFDSVRIQVIQG